MPMSEIERLRWQRLNRIRRRWQAILLFFVSAFSTWSYWLYRRWKNSPGNPERRYQSERRRFRCMDLEAIK